jgi:curved DNA-binding protein CbpA
MFFYHSATEGMIRANLDAFFTAKSDGMNSEDALQFMILTRYSLFPKKREEFIRLYALFQLYLEDKISLLALDDALHDFLPDTSSDALDAVVDAYGELIMVLRFHAPEIPNNVGEKEKEELKMLRGVISLMHIYESGAIFKSTQSFGFPTVKFLNNFIYTIDQEYYKRVGRTSSKQENVASSKFFKNREEYDAWKARKIKEKEQKRQSLRSEGNNINHCYQILGLKPNASKEEVEQVYKDLLTVWNPDAFADEPGLQQKAREKVKEIDEAYKKLMLHLSKRDNENIRQGNIQLKYKISVNDINTMTIEQERIGIRETDSEQIKTEEQESIKVSIDEIKEKINAKRAIIANLLEEVANLKRELTIFEAEYHARVGVLYVRLDELELELREYDKRIKLLKSRKIDNLVDLEKTIEEQFQKDKEKINKEKGEAEQYTEEYEVVKEKPKLDEESEKKLKSLYRELAKKYHPDMARTPEEKKRYNTIMAEINQAYNNKDLWKMEELAMRLKIPEEIFAETVEEEIERLQRESQKLDDIILRLEDELAALKNSDTYKLKMRADESKAQGRDLLKEIEDNLKAKIEQRDEELVWLKREFKNLSKDLA